MKKRYLIISAMLAAAMAVGGCANTGNAVEKKTTETSAAAETKTEDNADANTKEQKTETSSEKAETKAVKIELSDNEILVDGAKASTDAKDTVYTGAEIVYYKAGQGELYGEGSKNEEHTEEEAAANTVVTITKPGTYEISGKLSKGQIAIDLGEDAKDDPKAVVNLILNNADISCDVAPAIIAYNVYECGSDDVETATKDADVSETAGFHLIIADDSVNTVTGSHVAKIYKEGTTAEQIANDEAKKAHKYDAAIESTRSISIDGQEKGNGKLKVNADNEGIETRLHMAVNGGEITVNANDDSMNAGEDGVSVITINGGILTCDSGSGDGDEGDGIDSNGWIVINDGYIIACANARSQDSGLDSDNGIYINGGTVLASGHMYDEVKEDSKQNFMVLSFAQDVTEDEIILLSDANDNPVSAFSAVNDYSIVVYSTPELKEGDYKLYKAGSVEGKLNGSIYTDITGTGQIKQLGYTGTQMMGGPGGGFGGPQGEMPEGMEPGQMPEGMKQGQQPPEMPQGQQGQQGQQPPEMPNGQQGQQGQQPPEMPNGQQGQQPPEMPQGTAPEQAPGSGTGTADSGELQTVFKIKGICSQFSGIREA